MTQLFALRRGQTFAVSNIPCVFRLVTHDTTVSRAVVEKTTSTREDLKVGAAVNFSSLTDVSVVA